MASYTKCDLAKMQFAKRAATVAVLHCLWRFGLDVFRPVNKPCVRMSPRSFSCSLTLKFSFACCASPRAVHHLVLTSTLLRGHQRFLGWGVNLWMKGGWKGEQTQPLPKSPRDPRRWRQAWVWNLHLGPWMTFLEFLISSVLEPSWNHFTGDLRA